MEITELQAQLDRIEATALSNKNVLTFDEAARYMGVSKSDLYKKTSNRTVPFSKPRGKMCYFERVQLEAYLLQNPIATADELEAQASTYIAIGKKGGLK